MDQAQITQVLNYCLSECTKSEMPWCEFKHNFHSSDELGKDISAIANIARILNRPDGYIVFWVSSTDHAIMGTDFDPQVTKWKWNEDLIPWLHRKLWDVARFEFFEVSDYMREGRLVLCVIQSAQVTPLLFEDIAYIRIDTYTKPIKESKNLEARLWDALLTSSFDTDIRLSKIHERQIFELLDWEWYCIAMQYEPISEETAKEKLMQDSIIIFKDGLYDITNAGALLFARNLSEFHLENKTPRVITYRWNNKLHAINDKKWLKWYAIDFAELIEYVFAQIPKIENIESTRINEPLYPRVALREFIANAIIHQDFRNTGSEVLVEIYDDRIEISNPGIPLIEIDRFLDHPPKSRNEILADFMRRANHCEKRWSWVDRALQAIQVEKLPNPKIEKSSDFTRVTLYRTRPIVKLTNNEKAQAVYWHCALTFIVENEPMTNESVCDRFGIEKQNSATASRLIKLAKDAWKIKPFDPNSKTRKHAKYIPIWAG